jgi:hypothetical protein
MEKYVQEQSSLGPKERTNKKTWSVFTLAWVRDVAQLAQMGCSSICKIKDD